MRRLFLLLCAVLVLVPASLSAQTLTELLADQPELELVPKLEVTKCVADQRCMDQAAFKLYLQMRVQYVWLHKTHTGLVPGIVAELKKSAKAYDEAEKVQESRADRAEEAYDALFPKYVKETQRAERQKSLSIFGGGLPWLITTFVAGVGLGLYLGVTSL